jgi:MFS family permease
MSTNPTIAASAPRRTTVERLWRRELSHYPDTAPRVAYLGITCLATIVFYYELYVQASVAPKIISAFGFTFTEFVFVGVIGAAAGAFASLGAGLADRWGRANLVVLGTLLSALIVLFLLPNASNKGEYTLYFALLSAVEGCTLVCTPALIRDFSPQLGRGAAMAFWTMGPALGALIVTEVSSHTVAGHPDWQYQFRIAGVVGLVAWAIALIGLRELAPKLRDQLMVSIRDRALIEARAAGIDPERALQGHWRQMLKPDLIIPATAVGLFLIVNFTVVAFNTVYLQTVFGYSTSKANDLGNWFWITAAIALPLFGVASDKLIVRKPFMLAGALVTAVGCMLLAITATKPSTTYGGLVLIFVIAAAGNSAAYMGWLAAYTQTVEKHNPAAVATGLALYGWLTRIVIAIVYMLLTAVVVATGTVVDHGPQVQAIVAKYPEQVKVLQTVDPATLAALKADPNDQLAGAKAVSELSGLSTADVGRVVLLSAKYKAQLAVAAAIDPATLGALQANPTNKLAGAKAVGEIAVKLSLSPTAAAEQLQALGHVPASDLAFLKADGAKAQAAAARLKSVSAMPTADTAYLGRYGSSVARAAKDEPGQWQTWWWIAFVGSLLFIPTIFMLAGGWSPRKARVEELEHERMVQAELARLQEARAGAR